MRDLDSLERLNPQQKAVLRDAGLVHPSEVLLAPTHELTKRLRFIDSSQTSLLVQAVSRAVCPSAKSAAEWEREEQGEGVEPAGSDWVGTGDVALDRLLGGGLRSGMITEVAGESASGKSHLGLQLALTAQLAPYTPRPGSTILLTSERKISFDRMAELAPHLLDAARRAPAPSTAAPLPHDERAMLDNVHTMHVTEVDALDHTLSYILPNLLARIAAAASGGQGGLPARILVIDSIGALFRASYDSNSVGLTQRSKMLCVITDKLKELAVRYDLAVLVVNQVTDVFGAQPRAYAAPGSAAPPSTPQAGEPSATTASSGEPIMSYRAQSQHFSGQARDNPKEASLGLVWANGVSVRVMLARTGRRRAIDMRDLGRKKRRLDAWEREMQEEYRAERRDGGVAENDEDEDWQSTLIRRARLVFSPLAPPASIDYVIVEGGIRAVSDVYQDAGPPIVPRAPPSSSQRDEDDFGPDLLDDLGELPAEFWTGEAFAPERAAAVDRARDRAVEDAAAEEQRLAREGEREGGIEVDADASLVDEDGVPEDEG